MKIGLTRDEKICVEILHQVRENGRPTGGKKLYMDLLNWLIVQDVLRPPEVAGKWKFGAEYKKFKTYVNKHLFLGALK